MLEKDKTPLTLAVMAKAAELAPNVGDQYETDRLIRITNVSGSVFRRYELHRLGVHTPIVGFGDTSTKNDPNWWLASQLLDLDTKGLENAKAGEENAAIQSNDLQTQIEAIKKQYPKSEIHVEIVEQEQRVRVLSAYQYSPSRFCDPEAESTVTIVPNCPVKEEAKETQPTQEQLKAIFEHVTKLTAEQAENLGFQYSLTARTNFPRIELQIVSFSKYGNNKDEWKCTIVHQSPTDPKHEQYSFQSTYDFETTCHRLWWPVKCEEWEVGESLPEFISLPVAEFQELQSQIKELVDWKNEMTKPQPIAEPVQEGDKNAVEFIFPPRPNPAKGTIYCIHYGRENLWGDTVEEIATTLRRKGHEVRSTGARLVLKKSALWEALKVKIELQSRYREIVLEEIPFKHVEFPA